MNSDINDLLPRSPLMIERNNSALLIVDIQEKLMPHINNANQIIWNVDRLIDGCSVFEIPVFASEQYPQGLGPTVDSIRTKIVAEQIFEKKMFSVRECGQLIDQLKQRSIRNVVINGVESHVCVMQSALDLQANGFDVLLCIDAIGSRIEDDDITAMQRLETAGVTLVTTEMVLFEWCVQAGSAEFKKSATSYNERCPRLPVSTERELPISMTCTF